MLKKKCNKLKNGFLALSLKKKMMLGVVVLAIIILSIVSTRNKTQAATYQTGTVDKGSVISTLSESGNVSTSSQTNVASTTDGVIEEVYVKNGDEVVVGDNLFKVKSTATQAQQAAAYASYLSALNGTQTSQQGKLSLQAQLESARKTVIDAQSAVDVLNTNRSNSLNNPATKQPYTQNEIDSINSALTSAQENFTVTETKYKQSDTSISAASSSLTAAWLNYEATQDSIVKAPASGAIANFSSTVGSAVSAASTTNTTSSSGSSSSTSSSSTPVLVIGNFSNLVIKAAVNEIDVPKIQAGQKVTITIDALPDKTFVGTVSSIDTIGTSSSGVVTYNAYITLLSPPPDIKSGMTASAAIQTARKDDVLKVPSAAVQTTSGTSTVRVMKNGKVTSLPVEIGITSDTETEITSGLSEGDVVVTSVTSPIRSSGSTTASPFGGTNRGFGGAAGGFGGTTIRRAN